MPDARVVRPIPGTDLRPGDIILTTDDGTPVLARWLTDREIEALSAHPERVSVCSPPPAWLSPCLPERCPNPRQGSPNLRVVS